MSRYLDESVENLNFYYKYYLCNQNYTLIFLTSIEYDIILGISALDIRLDRK